MQTVSCGGKVDAWHGSLAGVQALYLIKQFSATLCSGSLRRPLRPSPTLCLMARLSHLSADLLLEEIGRLRVEHGHAVNGLSMTDVWIHGQEAALAAARQKPSESSSQTQNLLRTVAKALPASKSAGRFREASWSDAAPLPWQRRSSSQPPHTLAP